MDKFENKLRQDSEDNSIQKKERSKELVDIINGEIIRMKESGYSVKKISDGNHSFEDYNNMNNVLFIALCEAYKEYSWKSRKHYDEENDPMFNGDFIAGINTPKGVITKHIKLKDWDSLDVKEIDYAPKYDGYTNEDVEARVKTLKRINLNK